MNIRKNTIRKISLGLALLLTGAFVSCAGNMTPALFSLNETLSLTKSDIMQTANSTGIVESASFKPVYSYLGYIIDDVLVEVGDEVAEGDKLLALDTSALENQINTQKASLVTAKASAAQQVKSAEDQYNSVVLAYESGQNSALVAAQGQITAAEEAVNNAKAAYDRFKLGIDEDKNATLLNLETQIKNAELAVESANIQLSASDSQFDAADRIYSAAGDTVDAAEDALEAANAALPTITYNRDVVKSQIDSAKADGTYVDDYKKDLDERYDAADAAVRAAQSAIATANYEYQGAISSAESARLGAFQAEAQYDLAKVGVQQAEAALEALKKQKDATDFTMTGSDEDYQRSIESAQTAYDTAVKAYDAAKTAAESQLTAAQNTLESARRASDTTAAELTISSLERDLAKAVVLAPVSGTVTAVNAVEGTSCNGLMFVVEDTSRLVISTTVKEYDITSVKVGMKAEIKADTISGVTYEGIVTKINPTAQKNALGQTTAGMGDTLFETEVEVTSADTLLKIGMSVRISYIIEEATDVYNIPYDAVLDDSDGNSVLVAETADGGYILRKIPVTLGVESDLNVEISSDELSDGMYIISNADMYATRVGELLPVNVSK